MLNKLIEKTKINKTTSLHKKNVDFNMYLVSSINELIKTYEVKFNFSSSSKQLTLK